MLNGRDHAVLATKRMGCRLAVAAAVLGLVAAVGGVRFIAVAALMSNMSRQVSCTPSDTGVPIEATGDAGVTGEKLSNAAATVATGRELEVPDRGLWVALGTALQESGLRNLDHGDRDSLSPSSASRGSPSSCTPPAQARPDPARVTPACRGPRGGLARTGWSCG